MLPVVVVMLAALAWTALRMPPRLESCQQNCVEISKWVSVAARIPFVGAKGAVAELPVPAMLGYAAALLLGALAGLMAAITRLRGLNLDYGRGQTQVTLAKLFVYLLWLRQFFVHPSSAGDRGIFTLFESAQGHRPVLLNFVVIVFLATAAVGVSFIADVRSVLRRLRAG